MLKMNHMQRGAIQRKVSRIVCAVAPPPKRKKLGGNGGSGKGPSGNGGGRLPPDSNSNHMNNEEPNPSVVMALNSSFYSKLTPQYLSHLLIGKWGHACRIGLIKCNGEITLRIYIQETVSLPKNFAAYEDICIRVNSWNTAHLVANAIQEHNTKGDSAGVAALTNNVVLQFLQHTVISASQVNVVDIPLHVPTTGVRMQEFISECTNDIVEA